MKLSRLVHLVAAGAAAALGLPASAAEAVLAVRVEGPGLHFSQAVPLGHTAEDAPAPGVARYLTRPGLRRTAAYSESRPAWSDWSVLGDFYFRRDLGLRATGGVLGADAPRLAASQGSGHGLSLASSGARTSPTLGVEKRSSALPYLGMGYSELAAAGGWGFFADVGVVMLKPKSNIKLGNDAGSAWFISEEGRRDGELDLPRLLGDWRLSPLVQVGVSYSF
ncbi:hypothetical protein [Eleftheria terrae]|uniref:hypothetical protein n=1 Tax=Eleftheria terrae TaxID=1597781 RepID=UPI00263BBE45|nr:hypothetical protein [Eleftheria terrae]WKB54726.1 hypothetical protein N7L95_10220 [Eleftheria terrae]